MAAALALAVTLPAVSGAASLAAAGNVIPNPSFEEVCGQPTTACSWPDFVVSFGSAQRSTEIARTGEASLRIGSTTTAISTAGACFTSGVVPGRSYRFSYWYAARDPVLELRAYAQFWEQPNCTGGNTALYFNYPLLLDGQWHERSWTATAPAYARAARVVFEVHCSRPGTTCPEGGVAAYFDDFALEDQVPTSVSLNRLSALRTRHGVRLRWTTASERDVLGFNLYRRESGTSRKLNRSLIRSPFGGTVAERAYSFLDRAGAPAGTMYQLQAVELDGRRRWLASVSLPEVPVAASPALNELYPTRLYRVPSAAMEPTLHCARPGTGCLSRVPDMLVARRLRAAEPRRGDIVVFEAPALALQRCGLAGSSSSA